MDEEKQSHHQEITYKDVYLLLRKLQQDEFLESSSVKDLCLVKKCRQENSLFSTGQAIRTVFTDILHVLEQGTDLQKHYASILKGRFWHRYSIVKMTTTSRPDQISPRTFSYEQKKAINAFIEALIVKEQSCVKETPEPDEPGLSGSNKTGTEKSSIAGALERRPLEGSDEIRIPRRKLRVFGLGLLILIPAIWFFFVYGRVINSSHSDIASTTMSPAKTEPALALTSTETVFPASICPGADAIPVNVGENQFLRSQGVVVFDRESTPGLLNNKVRSLLVDTKGIWIGYFSTNENPSAGIGYYDKEQKTISNCNQTGITDGQNINDIVIDQNHNIWVGMEKGGIASFDGKKWRLFTIEDGLPSNWIYGLFVDKDNSIWAATYKGVARYSAGKWKPEFTVENGTLVDNRTHVVAVYPSGNIWVGYIENGLSVYHPGSGQWEHFDRTSGLSGDAIRGIAIDTNSSNNGAIWVATFDNGVSRYKDGNWTSFTTEDGLPGNEVMDISLDKFGRVWAATSRGVAYYVNGEWKTYNNLNSNSLSFGVDCTGRSDYCINDENIWIGTESMGLTHSRLPLTNKGIDILKVCFVDMDNRVVCPELIRDDVLNVVNANYPNPVKPGDTFYMKVTVSPFIPNQLLESRGDMLANIDADETMRYGTWKHIPVLGSIESGQEFTFIDTNNPFIAPDPDGKDAVTFHSTWRVWMHTRMVGPTLRIAFTVQSDLR